MTESNRSEPGASPPRRLSGEDAIFLYVETPSMPMHTMGTMILDLSEVPGGFGLDRVIETVASRIHRMPPFRQRLLEIPLGLGHPVMVDDPDFRVANHVHRRRARAPGGRRELAAVVAELAARPLDRGKPLWDMWLVEGLEDGRIALVTKLHHCILDGASGSSQMAGLLDLDPAGSAETPPDWSPDPLPGRAALALRSAGSRLVNPLGLGRLLLDTARGAGKRVRAQAEIARTRGEPLSLLESAPATPFNRAMSTHRSIAFGSAPLDAVKRVKKAFGVTVNDAVLAACALAVRRYLAARDALPDRPLACAVPVSLKSDAEKRQFSNKVSLMSVPLPTQLEDPAEIVRAVHRGTEDAKRVFQATDEDLMAPWLELLPPRLTALGARAYSRLGVADAMPAVVNLIVSNMMGPPVPLYFGGARVEAIYPMGPVGEGMGLNLTVLSNMGRLDVGVLACREAVPDPWEIADGVAWALEELERAAPAAAELPRAEAG